jgi:nitroimidazol reductase NimA-like FMN-containing flavoprotein (pyridoxamine 5'-phosphate oxidase superfamily)
VPTTHEERFLEILDEAQCRRLLPTRTIGRLGFTEDALPAILPVAFTLQGGHVLIAVRHDSSVVNAVRRSVVAFQVDEYDPASRTGWSVTVVGPSRIIRDPQEVAALGRMPVTTPPPDPARCYVAVQLGLVRGWRMAPYPAGSKATDVDATRTAP